jgi:hypothetical protein
VLLYLAAGGLRAVQWSRARNRILAAS